MKFSIHSRILFSAFIILILFMGLTGFVLDKAFRNNIESLQHENLRTQIYALLAAADINDNGQLQLPEEITEPRLNIAESNLYARIITKNNKIVWQSKSMLNSKVPFSSEMEIGKFIFTNRKLNSNIFTSVNFTTAWITDDGEESYIFQISEDKKTLNAQISQFRKNLWMWLAGVSILLIIVQTFILRWGLKPLRHVAEDLFNIEKGISTKLEGDYPKEIIPLTNNLNQLLDSSQQQLTRYRDALGNMAHSLKTPIAILQGIINKTTNNDKSTAIEQLQTINNIVEYQLQRAATVGRLQLIHRIELKPTVTKILNSLQKVHHDRNINLQVEIPEDITIKTDEGDLYELLGNLLENAFKWSNKKVSISASKLSQQTKITIEDDGPGISEDVKEQILLRGQRADQNTPGHGIGLAIVSDILLIYKGTMEIVNSEMGGAKIIIKI